MVDQAMFRLGESDYTLIKQQQQAGQDQTEASTETGANSLSKEDREAAMSLFRKAKLWGIHVSLPAEQLENLQRDVQGKGPGLAGKGQGLAGVSTAVHEVRYFSYFFSSALAYTQPHTFALIDSLSYRSVNPLTRSVTFCLSFSILFHIPS